MSEPLPTICVCREGGRGYHIINLSEYDPRVHRKYMPEDTPATVFPEAIAPVFDHDGIFDDMSEAELRDYIEKKSGKKPHHKLKRENLLAAAREA